VTRPTLVARVASVQTLVTLAALLAVMLLTWLGVSAMLASKTDETLRALLTRTLDYLESGSASEQVDWPWLAGEIDENRRRDVRFEVRDSQGHTLLQLGGATGARRVEQGCADQRGVRVCAARGRRYLAIAATDRTLDFEARNRLMLALASACVCAAVGVAFASVAVTRRAIRPLSDLARRIAAVEPGSGQSFEPQALLGELAFLEQRFADLVNRFEQTLVREKQFTAHASHELRTPLTEARAEIEALANLEKNTSPHFAAALTALSRLDSLIQVLLWFARAQAPLHGEDMEVVNLADVLAQQLIDLRRAQRPCSIEERLPDEALVRGDERLLAAATANLLDNAVKHGRSSAVEVALTRDGTMLELRITNGGPDIPEALREQIFVPFVRGEHGTAGFGLGLPFARAVTRAHGGDLVVANHGSGTTLLMRLPLLAWNQDATGFDSVQTPA
jgi:signal transduction histidine kinase